MNTYWATATPWSPWQAPAGDAKMSKTVTCPPRADSLRSSLSRKQWPVDTGKFSFFLSRRNALQFIPDPGKWTADAWWDFRLPQVFSVLPLRAVPVGTLLLWVIVLRFWLLLHPQLSSVLSSQGTALPSGYSWGAVPGQRAVGVGSSVRPAETSRGERMRIWGPLLCLFTGAAACEEGLFAYFCHHGACGGLGSQIRH